MSDHESAHSPPAGRGSVAYAMLAGPAFGVAVSCLAAVPAQAQTTGDGRPVELAPIAVEGERPEDYRVERSASPKFTAPLLDTPKTVTVIPREVIEDRAATSVLEVLRTTPGISLGAGEGGTPIGDRAFIRGFDARGDVFVDGVRNFGSGSDDSFNLEQVEIVKGPGSAYSGRGSTGGSLNLVTKKAFREDVAAGSLSIGTDATRRATADVNYVLSDTAALRLNAMAHDQEVAGRDAVEQSRWGFAPTLTLGHGQPTRITIGYEHLSTDDIPDYGHPFDPTTGKPVEVERDNFYGLTSRDFRETTSDVATLEIQHDITDNLTFRNVSRYSYSSNKYIVTKPDLPANLLAIGQMERESRSRNSDEWAAINQTELSTAFSTGMVRHSVVAGIEASREESQNRGFSLTPATVITDLANPNPGDPYNGTIVPNANKSAAETTTFAAYVFDTLELSPQWEVNLGLRLDDYHTTSNEPATNDSRFLNWQSGVVYKPVPNASVYVAFGSSSNPSGETPDAGDVSATNAELDPERSHSYEAGVKWQVFGERLQVDAAVFRTDKTNVRLSTGAGAPQVLEGQQRVDGFEIGLAGQITDAWKVFGGFSYLDSEIVDDNGAGTEGNELPFIAGESLSLWTSYAVTADLTLGGGATYMASRFANTANDRQLPSFWRFDAMAAYQLTEAIELQLNGINLADETYYDSTHNGQFAPVAPGRSLLLTTNLKF